MTLFSPRLWSSMVAGISLLPTHAAAQVYNGGGITAGVEAAGSLGLATADPFRVILSVLAIILNLVAIIAVFAIVIAGIYMIISLGNDEQIEKAKKIIKYTLIGLIVILFARLLVGLITNVLYGIVR